MAQKTVVQLIDDLDGGEASESLTFGLDGVEYTIDLSEGNAQKLRATFDGFVSSARRVGRTSSTGAGASRREAPGGSLARTREMNTAIRTWAEGEGLPVSRRGRISEAIVRQYKDAHPTLF